MLDRYGTPPEIAGFTYLSDLGAGGYSTVYLYEQHMPRREVAVKVMNADVEDGTVSRFESEANLMARVSSHPAILSIYGAGVSQDGHPFLVMEYCPPPQLGAILKKRTLSVADALSTAIQIAGAVETAHRAGIVHRDIKPANILFTTYKRPVLSDFGISAMSGPEGTEELRGMSVPWAPPEQLVGMRSANPASDVYSLGATTFAMLTGRSPFEREGVPDVYELSRRIVKDPVPPLGRQDEKGSIHRVLSIAMDKNPSARYPTALAFARALQKVQDDLNYSVTAVDLFHEADNSSSRTLQREEDDEATQLGVFSQVEVTADGIAMRVDDPPVMTTGARRIPDQTQDEESVRPSLLRRAIGGGLVLALTAVGAGIVYSQMDESEDKPSTFETIAPPVVDPVQKTDVSPPTNLEGQANGDGTVTFSWQPPNSEWHGRYLYRQVIAGKETTLESTKETSVTIQSDVGRTCLEVFSLREDGRSSTAVTTCVEG